MAEQIGEKKTNEREAFFSKLKTIASDIDKQVVEAKRLYKEKECTVTSLYEERKALQHMEKTLRQKEKDADGSCTVTSLYEERKALQHMEKILRQKEKDADTSCTVTSLYEERKALQHMEKESQATLMKMKQQVDYLDSILTLGKSLMEKTAIQLEEREKYMQQYGYVVKEDKKEVSENEEKEESTVTVSDATVVIKPASPTITRPVTSVNRSPQMEDFGISKATIDRLNALGKKQPATRVANTAESSVQKPDVTTSFSTDKTFCVKPGSSILTNKERPSVQTSPKFDDAGISQQTLNRLRQFEQKNPVSKRAINTASIEPQSVPDFFQHDGIIMTPSIFGKPIDRSVINIHEALASPEPLRGNIRDFQGNFDTSSTTKLFPQDIPAFPNMAAYSEIKENVSPKEPELLSQNTSTVMKEEKLEEPRGRKALFDDLPPSPKLYGNYRFTSK